MKVYVVTSEFDGERIIEMVFFKEQSAKDFCFIMNKESFGYYDYTEKEVR